jgi:molybdate transport system regulatory protein
MSNTRRIPTFHLKLDYGNGVRIGPGKVELLKLIQRESSISAAARAMNMSYRRAWLLVEETGRIFGQPVVTARVGGRGHGGASLTALGEHIIRTYDAILAKARAAAEAEMQAMGTDAPPVGGSSNLDAGDGA